jgi:hypothetical protein
MQASATFYWIEGMSLATSRHFRDVLAYRQSVRNPQSWLKLLRGKINFANALRVALRHPSTVAKSYLDELRELLGTGPQLAVDLKKLFAMKRLVTLFVSEGDPGLDILRAGAKRTLERGLKTGNITWQLIPGADHTFSQAQPRQQLVERLVALLSKRSCET